MATLLQKNLTLPRCPHCNVDQPNLAMLQVFQTKDHSEGHLRWWKVYVCRRCGGLVTASAANDGGQVLESFPSTTQLDESLPPSARGYLDQALNSLHAPAGAVMLAASSVDAMLKAKGYKEGSLYTRINKAAEDHLITDGMAKWAHDIRLDANDQRHADDNAQLPTA